jgi:hypothetical protein
VPEIFTSVETFECLKKMLTLMNRGGGGGVFFEKKILYLLLAIFSTLDLAVFHIYL